MKKMMSAACAAVMGCALPAAQAGGHYVAGVEGLQAASVPPPGTYYLGYLVHYDIDSFRAPDSSEARPGDAMGPGGNPGYREVLYGESNIRSSRRRLPVYFPASWSA